MAFASSSFNSSLHRPDVSRTSFLDSQSFSFESQEDSAIKLATLQAKLNKKLGPEYISQRPGPGGGPKLTYAEGWKIINLANEVFGFNGWSSSIVSLTTDFADFNQESRRYNVGVSAVVRITLRDGVYHEDVGYGVLENAKSKGAAFDKCKKEAVTDGVKRALRNFGNLLGNCLYDKQYTQEIVKIKVEPPKFDRDALHRQPQYDNSNASKSGLKHDITPAPMSALPQHMRPSATSTPTKHVLPPPPPATRISLPTPAQTPQISLATTMLPPRTINARPHYAQQKETASSAHPHTHHPLPKQLTPPAPAKPSPQNVQIQPQNLNNNDADASFDDDADASLFAHVDLSEYDVDIGRPIGDDEGTGGAIDFDEGGGGTGVQALSAAAAQCDMRDDLSGTSEHIQPQAQPQGELIAEPSHPLPHQQPQPQRQNKTGRRSGLASAIKAGLNGTIPSLQPVGQEQSRESKSPTGSSSSNSNLEPNGPKPAGNASSFVRPTVDMPVGNGRDGSGSACAPGSVLQAPKQNNQNANQSSRSNLSTHAPDPMRNGITNHNVNVPHPNMNSEFSRPAIANPSHLKNINPGNTYAANANVKMGIPMTTMGIKRGCEALDDGTNPRQPLGPSVQNNMAHTSEYQRNVTIANVDWKRVRR